MPEKRPFPDDGVENVDNKRVRSIHGSPVAPSAVAPESELERKKREAAEKIAALKARLPGRGGAAPSSLSPASTASSPASTAATVNGNSARPASSALDVAARIAAMKAKLAAPASATAATAAPSAPANDKQAQIQAQVAALKAKFARQQESRPPVRPPASTQAIPGPPPPPPSQNRNDSDEAPNRARGGLSVGLHPSLLEPAKPKVPEKQKGKRRGEASEPAANANPYLDDSLPQDAAKRDANYDASLQKQRDRKARQLKFNEKGKFIALAEDVRHQERMEAMERELKERARKAAIERATENSYLVPAPPDVEWWDEGLLKASNYDNLDDLNDDFITAYVQHPVLLAAPQDSKAVTLKPMFLTKQEQKKVRRQRRMADHKEEQAKIRLGLKPPPPPKVKSSNLMRVLGQEAVKDPTAVEARVRREVAQRAADHEAANADRQLTKEQRVEKLQAQQDADAAKGIYVGVYRVDSLCFGKHRFQISKNAEQNKLTGVTIFGPKMNLIIVEGGAHSIANYRKLMLNRIKWTENAMPQSQREDGGQQQQQQEVEWLRNVDERGALKDLSSNRCQLVFEGEEKQRTFNRWIPYRACETDGEAKDLLSRYKMQEMWTLAQSMTDEF